MVWGSGGWRVEETGKCENGQCTGEDGFFAKVVTSNIVNHMNYTINNKYISLKKNNN